MEDLRKARISAQPGPAVCGSTWLSRSSSWTNSAAGPTTEKSATAFFTLVSARYEQGSIILTSNKGFGEWGELLGDSVIASAVLDRLAAPQPHPQRARRELPPQREASGGTVSVATTTWAQRRRRPATTTTMPTDRIAEHYPGGSISPPATVGQISGRQMGVNPRMMMRAACLPPRNQPVQLFSLLRRSTGGSDVGRRSPT